MKILVKDKMNLSETEVEIRCKERDTEVEAVLESIKIASDSIMGEKENGDMEPVRISRVLYFEAVDRNVFAYTVDDFFRVRRTLYDLEDYLKNDREMYYNYEDVAPGPICTDYDQLYTALVDIVKGDFQIFANQERVRDLFFAKENQGIVSGFYYQFMKTHRK